jgi:hypothetical protein
LWLIAISAVFFIVASLCAGDMAGLARGIAFPPTSMAFRIPFYPASSDEDHERED